MDLLVHPHCIAVTREKYFAACKEFPLLATLVCGGEEDGNGVGSILRELCFAADKNTRAARTAQVTTFIINYSHLQRAHNSM